MVYETMNILVFPPPPPLHRVAEVSQPVKIIKNKFQFRLDYKRGLQEKLIWGCLTVSVEVIMDYASNTFRYWTNNIDSSAVFLFFFLWYYGMIFRNRFLKLKIKGIWLVVIIGWNKFFQVYTNKVGIFLFFHAGSIMHKFFWRSWRYYDSTDFILLGNGGMCDRVHYPQVMPNH